MALGEPEKRNDIVIGAAFSITQEDVGKRDLTNKKRQALFLSGGRNCFFSYYPFHSRNFSDISGFLFHFLIFWSIFSVPFFSDSTCFTKSALLERYSYNNIIASKVSKTSVLYSITDGI